MPIYEYRCPNGHTFEVFQRMSDPPPGACEVCGAAPVEKVLFPVAVHFKGKGFYSTDYGRGSRGGKDADSGSTGKDSSSSGGEGGSATPEKKSSGGEGGSGSTSTSDSSSSSPPS